MQSPSFLKEKPEQSNRQIAKQVKADGKTVGAVRKEMEEREEIPHVETRTDTRGRRQPAKRATLPPEVIEQRYQPITAKEEQTRSRARARRESEEIHADISRWQRVFAARKSGVDARDLLKNAARDLWQTLEINKTVHPESNGVARQDVVDALQDMAESADIFPDDAQRIFAESFKAPSTNGDAYSDSYRKDDQQDQQNIERRWDDPDISILDDRRGTLPEFPLEVFTPWCRQWVERASHGSGVTPAHVAIPLIGIVSSLIGTARRAQASRSWTQPLSLWTAAVGFSGSGKTPGLDTVRRALVLVERSKEKKIKDQQHAHEAKIEAAKAARAVWKEQIEKAAKESVVDLENYRAAKKAALPSPPPEAIVPGPFIPPRLYVSDATIERLAVY